MAEPIYKIMTAGEWAEATRVGSFHGSAVDRADGFIHFSTAGQVAETLRRHFAGIDGLVLLEVDPERLAAPLRWEPARGGALFPHLYARLDCAAVMAVAKLSLDDKGGHQLPWNLGE
ncbi:MAG: DUF952 domain-containing protein [Rhodothalassiaceae bacterium]